MMETVRADGDRQKPKIWCDGTYLFHVDVDRDPMRDAAGRPIAKVSTSVYTCCSMAGMEKAKTCPNTR